MSGIEVAALVAAIISAFSGAHGLISKFKKKRRERRLNKQNENAELALTFAGSRVQHAYDVDFRRLGSKFAKGDNICQRILMEQVIKLQQTVIALLAKAQDLDLQTIILPNVAEVLSGTLSARDTSVSALKEQFQRMAVAAPVNRRRLNPPGLSYATPFQSRSGVPETEPPKTPQNTTRVIDISEEMQVELAQYEVRAMWSYQGASFHNLSVMPGDVIKVLSRDVPSPTGKIGVVALGETKDGKIGMFPLAHVEGPGKTSLQTQSVVKDTNTTTTTTKNSISTANTTKETKVGLAEDEVVARISFKGTPSASLSFEKGDIIKVVTRDILSQHQAKGFVALARPATADLVHSFCHVLKALAGCEVLGFLPGLEQLIMISDKVAG